MVNQRIEPCATLIHEQYHQYYTMIASGHRRRTVTHIYVDRKNMWTYAHSNVQTTVSPARVTTCHNLPAASRISSSVCIWNGACWDYSAYIRARLRLEAGPDPSLILQVKQEGHKDETRDKEHRASETGEAWQKEKGAEGRAQPAAMCGECCHHYSNVMQISYFQLIPHFAGSNQGRDDVGEGE